LPIAALRLDESLPVSVARWAREKRVAIVDIEPEPGSAKSLGVASELAH